LGSLEDNELVGIMYSTKEFGVYTPQNWTNYTNHPYIEDVFYIDKWQ